MSVIGVDIGGTKIAVGTFTTKLIKVKTTLFRSKGSKKEVFEDICAAIQEQFTPKVTAIGIGFPSVIDKKGVVYETNNIPSFEKFPLKQKLSKVFNVPIRITNDANCAALAQTTTFKKDIVVLTLGTGLGGGIIINKKLHKGSTIGAGQFSEIVYMNSNLENYCSTKFFKRRFKQDPKTLLTLAKAKNNIALQAFREFGIHVGNAVSIAMNAINPNVVVLDGSIAQAYSFFSKEMKKQIKKNVLGHTFKNTKIKKSTIKHAGVLGACLLAKE